MIEMRRVCGSCTACEHMCGGDCDCRRCLAGVSGGGPIALACDMWDRQED